MPRSLFVQTDRKLVRTVGGSRRHLRVEVVAPRRPPRRPVNLALVLDHSGSMHGDKLNLAREGAHARGALAGRRGPAERRGLQRAGGGAGPLPGRRRARPASTPRRCCGGSAPAGTPTCAGAGSAGCEEVAVELDPGRLGRCLLLTDGMANRGVTDHETIVRHAAGLRTDGVTTSALGPGTRLRRGPAPPDGRGGRGQLLLRRARRAALGPDRRGDRRGPQRGRARRGAGGRPLPPGATVTSPNPFRVRSDGGQHGLRPGLSRRGPGAEPGAVRGGPGRRGGGDRRGSGAGCGTRTTPWRGRPPRSSFTWAAAEAYDVAAPRRRGGPGGGPGLRRPGAPAGGGAGAGRGPGGGAGGPREDRGAHP